MSCRKEIKWVTNDKGCNLVVSHHKNKDGYVQVTRNKKTVLLHRHAYESKYGTIPEGIVVMHSCDNPNCINLEHLTLGTPKDNTRDMVIKGRSKFLGRPSGYKNLTGKIDGISEKRIKKIRIEKGLTLFDVAHLTGVSFGQINKIENHISNGSLKTLKKIADALGVEFKELFN